MSITPVCPYFYLCGGCDNQDVAYLDQVVQKEAHLQQQFAELADSNVWLPSRHSSQSYPTYFRNKIRFGFVEVGGIIFPSRHQKGSDEADIPVERCFLQSPAADQIINTVARFANSHRWSIYQHGSGWLKHVLIRQGKATGQILVSLVTDQGAIPEAALFIQAITQAVPQITSLYQATSHGKDNTVLTDTLLWGAPAIQEKVGEYTFQISPHAFFQTNAEMVTVLYDSIREAAAITNQQTVWDLYAGSATIGIYLSKQVKQVVSIENNPQNILDAQQNIRLNAVHNLTIIEGAVEKTLTSAFLNSTTLPDCIILDPPRAGLAKQLTVLLPNLKTPRIVYVSCNPATCFRDCQSLIKSGYRLQSLQMIDMFPHSLHSEMIAVLDY